MLVDDRYTPPMLSEMLHPRDRHGATTRLLHRWATGITGALISSRGSRIWGRDAQADEPPALFVILLAKSNCGPAGVGATLDIDAE